MDDEGGGEEGNGSGKDRIPDVLFSIVISPSAYLLQPLALMLIWMN